MRYLYNFFHIFDIIAIPVIVIFILPIFTILFFITGQDVKFPDDRKKAIIKYKKLYPKSLFKAWLRGFKI